MALFVDNTSVQQFCIGVGSGRVLSESGMEEEKVVWVGVVMSGHA
jgi:hypothetical protein